MERSEVSVWRRAVLPVHTCAHWLPSFTCCSGLYFHVCHLENARADAHGEEVCQGCLASGICLVFQGGGAGVGVPLSRLWSWHGNGVQRLPLPVLKLCDSEALCQAGVARAEGKEDRARSPGLDPLLMALTLQPLVALWLKD